MNENQIKKEEIEYKPSRITKRALALLVDVFLTIFTALILFACFNGLASNTPFALEEKSKRDNLQIESSLYTSDFVLISDYVDSTSFSTREKNEYLSKHIEDFYSNPAFIVGIDPYKQYEERKLKALDGTTSLFIENEGKIKENELANPSSILSFYKNEIENECLKYLYSNEIYINSNKFFFILSFVVGAASLTLSFLVYYLILPLTAFKKGKRTIGMAIFKIGLVGKNGLSLKALPYLGRVVFDYFVFIWLSFVSFLIPWGISFTMLLFSKRCQSLDDYVLNQYKVDISRDDIYLDYGDYKSHKENRDKASIENKDFEIETKKNR